MKQNGITLITLVITIIILIILAGVTISLTIGDNGLFHKAKEAKELYSNAQTEEEMQLNELGKTLSENSYNNANTSTNTGSKQEFEITTPYVGTSEITVKVNTDTINEEISKYLYIVNGEVTENTTDEININNLPEDTQLDVVVIAITKENKELISKKTIKTEPRTYLYNMGDQCEDITGGWSAAAIGYGNSATLVTPQLTFNSDNMNLYLLSTSGLQGGSLIINNKIDYSNYKKFCFRVTAKLEKYSGACAVYLCANKNNPQTFPKICYTSAINNQTFRVDISGIENLEDIYYYIQSHKAEGAANFYIYEVWLEK